MPLLPSPMFREQGCSTSSSMTYGQQHTQQPCQQRRAQALCKPSCSRRWHSSHRASVPCSASHSSSVHGDTYQSSGCNSSSSAQVVISRSSCCDMPHAQHMHSTAQHGRAQTARSALLHPDSTAPAILPSASSEKAPATTKLPACIITDCTHTSALIIPSALRTSSSVEPVASYGFGANTAAGTIAAALTHMSSHAALAAEQVNSTAEAAAATAAAAASTSAATAASASTYVPSPYQPGWEIWVGAAAGIIPFIIGAYEFGKRIVIQQRCEVCGGKGLVPSGGPGGSKYMRKCPQCGGFFPWVSWKLFLTSTAAPGNGGPLMQPKGQTSVFYSVPPPPDKKPASGKEQQPQQAHELNVLTGSGDRAKDHQAGSAAKDMSSKH